MLSKLGHNWDLILERYCSMSNVFELLCFFVGRTICGLTQFTNKAHIARACLEAVCFQNREVCMCTCAVTDRLYWCEFFMLWSGLKVVSKRIWISPFPSTSPFCSPLTSIRSSSPVTPSLLCPLTPSLLSLPFLPPLEVCPLNPAREWGGSTVSFPSVSGQSPAAKCFLVHFSLCGCILASIFKQLDISKITITSLSPEIFHIWEV